MTFRVRAAGRRTWCGSLLAAVLAVAPGCGGRQVVDEGGAAAVPAAVPEPATVPESSELPSIPIDDVGNRYVIDPRTESCFLVLAHPRGAAPARVDCALLADNVEAAAEHITWSTETQPRSAGSSRPPFGSATAGARRTEYRDPEVDVSALAEAHIDKTGDHSWNIEREFLDKVLSSPALVARGARIVPSIRDGKPDGFKLYAIRPGSVYAAIGLKNGDTIKKINGHVLGTRDQALEVYKKIREAKKIVVELMRRGERLTLTYRIGD